jgi:hypothetical protein
MFSYISTCDVGYSLNVQLHISCDVGDSLNVQLHVYV